MKYVIALFTLVSACGTAENSAQNARSPEATVTTISEEEAEYGSFYAATDADLPACNKEFSGRLVYVASSEIFKSCTATGYQTVTIKGKDGKDGTNGTSASVAQQNEWTDSITGKQWLFGHVGNQLTTTTECSGNYKVPTTAELQDACYHGLFLVYVQKVATLSYGHAWGAANGEIVLASTCLTSSQSNGSPSTIICLKK